MRTTEKQGEYHFVGGIYPGRTVRKAWHTVKYELGSVLRRDSSGYSDLGDRGRPVRSNIRCQGCERIDVHGQTGATRWFMVTLSADVFNCLGRAGG